MADPPILTLPTPEDAAALGARIARALRLGQAVCLSGALGAGKSTLARGLVRALTSPGEEVPSPTFTLVQAYAGRDFPIAHLDLYRLKRPEEIDELGLDEALETGCAVIEWPERLGDALPADRLDVRLEADAAGAASPRWWGMAYGGGVSVIFSDPRGADAPPDLTGRREARQAFLAAHGLADALRQPVAGDASTRSYTRLRPAGRAPLMLMDAPPAAESAVAAAGATAQERIALGYNAMARLAGGRVDAFAALAGWLRARGLSAPQVHALDAAQGFAVLEDLGDDLFRDRLETGADPQEVYGQAVDVLVALHAEPPPAAPPIPGGGEWALPPYDALALQVGGDLFLQWWPALTGMAPPPEAARAEWSVLWAPVLARGEAAATVFTHRDYHAENLLWLPERAGPARVGLLDFQDAVRGHPAWDLFHLLQDARRDVPEALEAQMVGRYLAARPDLDGERFRADYAALGALNATRILGPVFARQIGAFGREKYRAFLPRTWRALERNLRHPDLAGLCAWFDRWVPPEHRA